MAAYVHRNVTFSVSNCLAFDVSLLAFHHLCACLVSFFLCSLLQIDLVVGRVQVFAFGLVMLYLNRIVSSTLFGDIDNLGNLVKVVFAPWVSFRFAFAQTATGVVLPSG